MAKNRVSLDDFIKKEKSHCFTCIKEPNEKLSEEVCKKIKDSLINKMGRALTNEEFAVYKIFSGLQVSTIIHSVRLHIGNADRGMLHILIRHFRDNGDKNGGRVEYIDIILIPEILDSIIPVLKDNGYNEYKYIRADGKVFFLITYENKRKWYIKSFYSSDNI